MSSRIRALSGKCGAIIPVMLSASLLLSGLSTRASAESVDELQTHVQAAREQRVSENEQDSEQIAMGFDGAVATEEDSTETEIVSSEAANADSSSIVASGTEGTCPWTLDEDGLLSIGAGTLSRYHEPGDWNWDEYRTRVKTVRFVGAVQTKATFTESMFEGMCELVEIQSIQLLDTSSACSLDRMFAGCTSLKSLDLTDLNTSGLGRMDSLFEGCSSLTSLNLSGWDTSHVGSADSLFSGCTTLENLNIAGWDTSQISIFDSMFKGCKSLVELDLSGWDTSSAWSMFYMFSDCSSLTSLDLSGWDVSNVYSIESMFSGCESLTSLDLSTWDTSSLLLANSAFLGCYALDTLDLSGWDTSHVTEMASMFENDYSLISLDLTGWDVSAVEYMGDMFNGCSALTALDIADWDTSSVEYMKGMFRSCSSLSTLDLSSWNTSSVINMKDMFADCSDLSTLNASNWNTSKVTNMSGMFSNCCDLRVLDLSGWNTSSVVVSDEEPDMFSDDYQYRPSIPISEITVGSGWTMPYFPDKDFGSQKWWSSSQEKWFTKSEIVSERVGVPDTYLVCKPFSYLTVTLSPSTFVYDGEQKQPDITVTDGSTTLIEYEDYEVLWPWSSGMRNPGTYTITINGAGEYSGTTDASFTITNTASTTYTVTYNANGGTGTPSPQTKEQGVSLTLSGTKPTKKYVISYNANGGSVSPASKSVSCTFKSWNTAKNGGGTSYSPGSTYSADADATLYAQWTNPTAGALATPTRSGYSFDGWYTAASGGSEVTSSTTVTASMTVYAHWASASDPYDMGDETYSFENYVDSDSPFGHCFGMSMTSAGYHTGLLGIGIIGGSASTPLYGFGPTWAVKQPICRYQGMQGSCSAKATVAGGSYYLTDRFDIASDWAAVVNYVKGHGYDGTGLLQVGFRKNGEGGHAVNFLRYERVGGEDRIYIYDNNFPEQETYLCRDSFGRVLQKPLQTFSGTIDCVALRDVRKYFGCVGGFDATRVIYMPKDVAVVQGFAYTDMESDAEYVMYEIPADVDRVTIVPNEDNADFIYMDTEYSFGQVSDGTRGELRFASVDEHGGVTEGKFTIFEASAVTPSVTLSKASYTYDGKVHKPTVTVRAGGKMLKAGTDYDVTYPKGMVNAGKYTVKVTLKGRYIGSGSKAFTIEKALQTVTASNKTVAVGKAVSLGAKASGGGGLTYKSADTSIATVSAKGTVTGRKAGKVKVTVSAAATANHKAASKTVTVTVTGTSLAKAKVTVASPQYYTGKALKPAVKVTLGGKTLKASTDYTVSYVNNTKVGTATVTVIGKGNYSGSVKATFKIVDRWQRLAGANAVATMQAIVRADGVFTPASVDTVVVAGRRDFKAALAGTGLAGLYKAPLLITDPNSSTLSGPAKAELQRLKPSRVIVVGDTGVVPASHYTAIQKAVPNAKVSRIAGGTASATAVAIAKAGKSAATKWGRTCVVATQAAFKDALSIAPYAYAKHAPIFFTESTRMADGKGLSPETLSAIKAGGYTKVLIVGGELAVPKTVESQLKAVSCQRLAGANAIETSRLIGQFELGEGMNRKHLAVATTWDFADALAGASLAGAQNSIIVLANQTGGYGAFNALISSSELVHGHILGGPFALSEASEAYFRKK